MKFVGDLSSQDAKVLEAFGRASLSILEFGCGGSTQILAQSLQPGARLVSVETDPAWIDRTRRNLQVLELPEDVCRFLPYEDWRQACEDRQFDFVFVDGVDGERAPFARAAFPLLQVGGWILFHDTRRRRDLRNLVELIMEYHTQVGDVRINFDRSNLSGFRRQPPQPYENWNVTEHRSAWMEGIQPPPEDWPRLL